MIRKQNRTFLLLMIMAVTSLFLVSCSKGSSQSILFQNNTTGTPNTVTQEEASTEEGSVSFEFELVFDAESYSVSANIEEIEVSTYELEPTQDIEIEDEVAAPSGVLSTSAVDTGTLIRQIQSEFRTKRNAIRANFRATRQEEREAFQKAKAQYITSLQEAIASINANTEYSRSEKRTARRAERRTTRQLIQDELRTAETNIQLARQAARQDIRNAREIALKKIDAIRNPVLLQIDPPQKDLSGYLGFDVSQVKSGSPIFDFNIIGGVVPYEFAIVTQNRFNATTVDPDSGTVKAGQDLAVGNYSVTLQLEDGESSIANGLLTFEVTNDPPTITPHFRSKTLDVGETKPGSVLDTFIFQDHPSEGDLTGEIGIFLKNGIIIDEQNMPLSINQTGAGEVATTAYLEPADYFVGVLTTDSGGLVATASIRVTITNSYPTINPNIRSKTLDVSETKPGSVLDTFIFQDHPSEGDLTGEIGIFLKNGIIIDEQNMPLSINQTGAGEVATTAYLEPADYFVGVLTTDSGGLVATASIRVTVTNTAPQLSVSSTSKRVPFPEAVEGAVVVYMEATDHPAETNLTYAIADGNSEGLFQIDSEGKVTFANDASQPDGHVLSLSVEDSGGLIATVNVSVRVEDMVPVFGQPYYSITLTTSDVLAGATIVDTQLTNDSWDTHTVSVDNVVTYAVLPNPGTDYFSVDQDGVLRFSDTMPGTLPLGLYQITLSASDARGQKAITTIILDIIPPKGKK